MKTKGCNLIKTTDALSCPCVREEETVGMANRPTELGCISDNETKGMCRRLSG